ncbi:MAG: IS1182 family transposase [Streptococcaceae bacterium]|jgi:transposase|nr:IS1182 family transposase [Streptococcaceae bacterium]
MIKTGQTTLSSYLSIYDILIPSNHEFRRLKALVDFQFVYDELVENYCLDNGRPAYEPIQMFKYLYLKLRYKLSDRDLIARCQMDMACKFFLDLSPEDDVIDASSLSKFRTQRIQDMRLIDLLIQKTLEIAIREGVLKSKRIILDATHSSSRFNQKSPSEILKSQSKALRKAIYQNDPELAELLPQKPEETASFEAQKSYCEQLIETVGQDDLANLGIIREQRNLLEEKLSDIAYAQSFDSDARVGYKAVDKPFVGYKNHIALSEERLITAVVVTSGEKADGNYLQALHQASMKNGMNVEGIVGDRAYSWKDNIEYCEANHLELFSRLNSVISEGHDTKGFTYVKDADTFICPAGEAPIRQTLTGKRKNSDTKVLTCFYDIEKCQVCPLREGCYKTGSQSKSHSRSIPSNTHQKQKIFEDSVYFQGVISERYKIEAKNSELKQRHGLDRAYSRGLFAMTLQTAMTVFVVNMKRIMTLIDEK